MGNMDIVDQYHKNADKSKGQELFIIRKASVTDVKEILELINGFAQLNLMLPRGPQYLYENIRDFVIAVPKSSSITGKAMSKGTRPKIVACASLHVLWEDIAEVRAAAVHPDIQKQGLGKRITEYIIEEARLLGIKRLFAFTLTEEFYKKLGFERKDKEELPAKVWGECTRCPKYFHCDEIGMILNLSP